MSKYETVRRLFSVPGEWGSVVLQRRAEVLHLAHLCVFFGGFLYVFVPTWILLGQPVYIFITILISVVGSILLRKKYLRMSGIWTLGTMWLMFTLGSVTEGGITSSSFPGSISVVVLSGLVFGLRSVITISSLTILCGGFLVYLSYSGLLPEPEILYTELNIFTDFSLYVIVTAIFVGVAIRRIDSSTLRSERELEERKLAEAQLLSSQERLQALTEATFEGLGISENGIVIYVNRQLAEIGGYSVEELIGRPVTSLIHPEDIETVQSMMKTKSPGPYTHRMQKKDGSTAIVEVRSRPLTFHGRPARITAVRDITEKATAERERDRLEEQLRQSQKMEAVGRLAGGIAHDFNNILSAIMGYSELLLKKVPKDSYAYAKVHQIYRAGERAGSLTRQLLAFGRKQTLEMQTLNPNNLIGEISVMLQRLIGEDIRLVTDLSEETWNIKGDKTQVEQILINLTINSRDAMPDGGTVWIRTGNLTISSENRSEHTDVAEGEYVALKIVDVGTGMDDQTMRNLFEPFYTTKPVGKGTGLGLATVYGIVKQHGGAISVNSAKGKGTTMSVLLPRSYEAIRQEDAKPLSRLREISTATILLVEDEESVRSYTEEILGTQGYSVYAAATPKEAVERVIERALIPDLLVTDVIMPGMNGKELFLILRERLPKLKVLYMSGYSADVIADRGILEEGANLLHKPFSGNTLLGRVEEAINA